MNNLKTIPTRYDDVAVILHWFIALLIIGLLAMGKYMHGLEDEDPQKFMLIQLHKSFGIMALLAVIGRLIWRTTYTAPAHPSDAPAWEAYLAKFTHASIYLFMLSIPFSGWLMVSASPLDIDTYLFNAVKWPHVPGAQVLQKNELASRFHYIHAIGANVLIVLLFMHIGGALKHHLINKDNVLSRMLPVWSSKPFVKKLLVAFAIIATTAFSFRYLAMSAQQSTTVVTANNSEIGFITMVGGTPTRGTFGETMISLKLNDNKRPENNLLTAEVKTASATTDNIQANGTILDPDWFDSASYPVASFTSTTITKQSDRYWVVGDMTVKGISKSLEFPMYIEPIEDKELVEGTFTFNRFDYGLGLNDEPTDENVSTDITVEFSFER